MLGRGVARRAVGFGLIASLLLLLALPGPVAGSVELGSGSRVELRASGLSRPSLVPAAAGATRGARAATFIVTYDSGFQANPAARAAFQRAVDIWSTRVTTAVPIIVDARWEPLSAGVLGAAGAAYTARNFPGAPRSDTWYPAALANKLAGVDLVTSDPDIVAAFNSSASWYYGTDGAAPGGTSDLVSVVLHELGHGLGFSGSAEVRGGRGYVGGGPPSAPEVYDRYVVQGGGLALTSLASGSVTLAQALTSADLYFDGTAARAANGGARPRLFAPLVWEQGSSYSHLDEATYPAGTANSLMTPLLNGGEAIHDPGPIALGVFADLGWAAAVTVPPTATPTATPRPRPTGPLTRRALIPLVSRGVGFGGQN